MKPEGLFINGVFESVLEEILRIQDWLPDHIMFLQPYNSDAIVHLRDDTPTTENPTRLYLSITTDLSHVHYQAEIVGWDDKRTIPDGKRNAVERLLWTLQPNETGLYDASRVEGKPSVNLIHVRRLQKLENSFSVSQLTKTSDGVPLSPDRTTAGGWSYVRLKDA